MVVFWHLRESFLENAIFEPRNKLSNKFWGVTHFTPQIKKFWKKNRKFHRQISTQFRAKIIWIPKWPKRRWHKQFKWCEPQKFWAKTAHLLRIFEMGHFRVWNYHLWTIPEMICLSSEPWFLLPDASALTWNTSSANGPISISENYFDRLKYNLFLMWSKNWIYHWYNNSL